ncbi:hypothetical protein M378DRAFT_912104 [Amanita muscaria Koide BX008]|uniref:Uncharacterized protein n=1 Tax=Amanita muscaria (strain Koide BX008) TaxID=946122 RepID=A0A0C2WV08_AMAMK|nr:hypothetical protein M378DRAFT_912104 [Amanita muscaria Koide BX008]
MLFLKIYCLFSRFIMWRPDKRNEYLQLVLSPFFYTLSYFILPRSVPFHIIQLILMRCLILHSKHSIFGYLTKDRYFLYRYSSIFQP